jgi:outer membrane protein assembly factor BamA
MAKDGFFSTGRPRVTVKDLPQNPHRSPSPSPPSRLSSLPLLLLVVTCCAVSPATAQTTRVLPIDTAAARRAVPFAELRGRRVEEVRVEGNTQVSSAVIRNVIRTRVGEPFDPETAAEDYQRIFSDLKTFSNVESFVSQTASGGVIVVFKVTEQRQVREIAYIGNSRVETTVLQQVVDLKTGQSIDAFRISMARRAIEQLYKDKNYPYAHVTVNQDALTKSGVVEFNIVEGPNVRVRRVAFIGNHSMTSDRLKNVVHTKYWIWIFRPGTFDPEDIDDDVARLKEYYVGRGFFDVRVGRKLIWSPDLSELQVDFVIEEGPRYRVGKVSFKGNTSLSEVKLREKMKMLEGAYYDETAVERGQARDRPRVQPIRIHLPAAVQVRRLLAHHREARVQPHAGQSRCRVRDR